jgi:hypothetical protein
MPRAKHIYEIAAAAIGWAALALQLYLLLRYFLPQGVPLLESVLRFFMFFTVVTNTLVALIFTLSALGRSESVLTRPSVKAAAAVYIAVVMIVYETMLRGLWSPQGAQLLADILLHDVIPVAYVVYWRVFVRKLRLPWRSVVVWLIYPLGYCGRVLWRGAAGGFYPYPFLDAGRLGYGAALLNCGGMLLLFVALGAVVVAMSRALSPPIAP